MSEIQRELQGALRDLLAEVGSKLKPDDRAEIQRDFDELIDMLERLKSGRVFIALFGKTSVGKSAITNALLDDDVARVGVEIDLTSEASEFRRDPWTIVDMPGVMGKREFEDLARKEANKAHGHIFCIDGEPYGPELELFEMVHAAVPHTPKIVFVNKWDQFDHKPSADREKVRALIQAKMGKFVKSPADIVYGSAQRFDPATDRYVRQELPQLLERMYEDAGTLGMVMNVIDPAQLAENLSDKMRERIMEVRTRLARKIVGYFGVASVVGTVIPLSQLVLTPGILAAMVFTIMRVMGVKESREGARKLSVDLLKAVGAELAAEFVGGVAAEIIISAGAFLAGPLLLGALGGLGYFKYRRTAILGEVTIEYVRNGCSWGGEDKHVVIQRCKQRAIDHYMKLRKADA